MRESKVQKQIRITNELLFLENNYPNLIRTVRDDRAVIHWPQTLARLADMKANISTKYGITDPESHNARGYMEAMREADDAASNWPLCSCGSLCRAIPRIKDANSCPVDPLLKKHGIRFMHDVRAGDFVAAEASMEKIERRAIAVLRKLGKKKVNYS